MSLRVLFANHGKTSEEVFQQMGLNPVLADRIDQRVQSLPLSLAERIGHYLQEPVANVISAANGRVFRAPAVAIGSKPSW